MLIEYNNERYLVLSMRIYETLSIDNARNILWCMSIEREEFERILLSEVSIIDGRLPRGISVRRKTYENEQYLIIEYDEIFRNEKFWDGLDNEEPYVMLCLYKYINEIKALHDLPLTDISTWEKKLQEEIKQNRKKTPEQERQEKINAELEEYLRIGENLPQKK